MRVVLPIMVPNLLLVGVIIYIGAACDVASMALVAKVDTKTLALLQPDYMVEGRYEAGTIASLEKDIMSPRIALLSRSFGLRIEIRN